MKSSSSKNSRTKLLLVLLLCLVLLGYRFVLYSPLEQFEESNQDSKSLPTILLDQLSTLNLDISVLTNSKFDAFVNIEKDFISLPIGKDNPFISEKKDSTKK